MRKLKPTLRVSHFENQTDLRELDDLRERIKLEFPGASIVTRGDVYHEYLDVRLTPDSDDVKIFTTTSWDQVVEKLQAS